MTTISAARFIKRGGIIFSAVILLSQILLTACGLPNYAYLYPPTDVKSRLNPDDGEYDLIFKNAYQNSINFFSGYEIYYKIYDPLDSDTSVTEYKTDKNTIGTTSGAGDTILKNKKFSRLFTTTSKDVSFIHNDTKPAFPLETSLLDENFYIRLLFNQDSIYDSYYAATYESTESFTKTPYLYRYVRNEATNTTAKKFFDSEDFDINDADMPSSIDAASLAVSNSGGYYLYITFYILSFGRDPENVTSLIHSAPVYLGTLKFNCSLTNN